MVKTTAQYRQMNKIVRQTVLEVIREIFNDPDYGLPLAPKTIQRLKRSAGFQKAGRVIQLEEILKKYSK